MKNKNIIKAMAIGISASMALQPVTVLAENANPEGTEGVTEGSAAQTQGSDENQQTQQEAFGVNAIDAIKDASKAIVGTESSNDSTESVNDEQESVDTTADVKNAVDATADEQESVDTTADVKNAVDATTDEQETVKEALGEANVPEEYKDAKTDLTEANTEIGNAKTAVENAQQADQAVKNYNTALDNAESLVNEITDSLTDGTLKEDDEISEAGVVNVDEFKQKTNDNAVADATAAKSQFETAAGDANSSSGAYDDVISDSNDYVSSEVNNDTTGALLEQIKADAENADQTYEDAVRLLGEANDKLEKAQTEYDEANIAYGVAEQKVQAARKAYEELVEPANGATEEKIQAAKNALKNAEDELGYAETNLTNARNDVENSIGSLNRAKYARLLTLKKAMDEADDADKAAKKAEFTEELIKYYYAEKGITVTDFVSGEFDLSGLDQELVSTDENGNKKYVYDYDENGNQLTANVPDSVLAVTYTDEAGESKSAYYTVEANEDGSFTLTEKEASVISGVKLEPTAAYYTDANNNQVSSLPDDKEIVEIKDADDKLTGAHVSGEVLHDFGAAGNSEESTVDEVPGAIKYVKSTSETTQNPLTSKTTEYTSAEYQDGWIKETKSEVVKEDLTLDDAQNYDGFVAKVNEYKNDQNKADVQILVRNYLYTDLLPDWIQLPKWIPVDLDENGNLTNNNSLISEIAQYIDGGIDAFFKDAKSYRVSYAPVTYENVEYVTDTPNIVNAQGIVVEEKELYDKMEYKQVGTISSDVTNDYKNGNAQKVQEKKNIFGFSYDDDVRLYEADELENRKNSIKNQKELEIRSEIEKTLNDNQSVNVVVTVSEQEHTKQEIVKENGKWVWKDVFAYYTFTYTARTTITTTTPVYEWEKVGEESFTKSKVLYSSNDYTYVPASSREVGNYYNLSWSNVQNGTGVLNSQSAEEKQKYADQQHYNDYVAAVAEAEASYQAAKDALTRAKNEVNALEAAKANKKSLVDSKKKLETAEAEFAKAAQDKEAAEEALRDAKAAQTLASTAVTNAGLKKTAATNAVNMADQAKKGFDNRPVVTPENPTNSGDDNNSNGTSDQPTGGNGTAGNNGTAGGNGTSGNNGATGGNGTSGNNGATGGNGTSGNNGTTGGNGTSGGNGTTGGNGTSGNNGTTGGNGTSGNNGTTGGNGTSGNNGTTAGNGTNGSNGTIGGSNIADANGTAGTTDGITGSTSGNGANVSSGDVTGTTNDTIGEVVSNDTVGEAASDDTDASAQSSETSATPAASTSIETPAVIATVASNDAVVDGAEVLGAKRSPAGSTASAKTSSINTAANDTANATANSAENANATANANDSANAAVANGADNASAEKETTTNTEVATIADEAPAKAATPIETQKGFPYWVLIILAAIAGVSVEEYVRRKNENSKNDSKKN